MLVHVVTKFPRFCLIFSLLLAVGFGSFVPFVKTVNNVDYFTLTNNPDEKFYQQFKRVFGNDEFFVIAYSKKNMFTPENLRQLKQITNALESVQDVKKIISLANVDDIVGGDDDFTVTPFLSSIPSSPAGLNALRRRVLANYLYRHNLVSSDGNTVGIVVSVYERPDDPDYRRHLINKVKKTLSPFAATGVEFHLAGWTVTDLSLSQYMKRDIAIFIPVTYLLVMLTIWLFFQNWRLMLLAVANITACLTSTMGLLSIAGITLNNVTTIVPPLIMALALSDTVHIFSHLDEKTLSRFPDQREALAHVLRKVILPCFLTTLTTAIGFLSLCVSKVPPIKEFALMSSAGMVFEFYYSFFLLPPLILLFKPGRLYCRPKSLQITDRFLTGLSRFISQHAAKIVVASAFLLAISLGFAAQVKVETDLLSFFKPHSPERRDLAFIENHLSGVGSFDISFQSAAQDAFKKPENLKVIENIERFTAGLQGVDVTLSLVDFIKEMNKAFHRENPRFYAIPGTYQEISQYLLLYDADEIGDYVNDEYNHARIAVRIDEHGSAKQAVLLRLVRDHIASLPHGGMEIRVTGRALQAVNTISALVNTQLYSLSLAALVISIIMFIVLRSIKIGLLSLVPNIFPIVLNFGLMGFLGIPINTATALIATVALGVAVDDTIHFLLEYSKKRSRGDSIQASVDAVLREKGRAIISSSIIICIGFGVLMFSRFMPTVHFGFLSAVIMASALIGDIVVLPAVLLWGQRFRMNTSQEKGNIFLR